MSKERISLDDTLIEVVTKMSEGNPGAMRVCMDLMAQAPIVDPDCFGGGYVTILFLDSSGIYGSRIWMLYKDVCGESIVNTIAVIRSHQLGFITNSELQYAIDNRGEGLDVPDLLAQVQDQLPAFNRT